ncbi:GA module-containing protein, partial [Scandinavium sp.]|uniref:GA module-containing protein n=1 Tax=Scandinavium sp. TaxID=2830653 RepID=UPI00289838A6
MNGTIDFFSPSGEKLASTAEMTGAAPAKSGAIRIPVSARDVTGVQKDKNALNILTKDNQKIVIKDFFGDAKKKLVFDDGKEIFEGDYLPNEQFNGLQFKPLQSIDEVFEGAETAANDSDDYVWVVPLIAAAAIGGLGIAAINHKGSSSKIKGRDTAKDKLDNAKDDANKAIDDMEHLTDKEKDDAHKAVDEAKNEDEVNKAVEDAAEKNLEGAKDDANKAIDDMEHLTDK